MEEESRSDKDNKKEKAETRSTKDAMSRDATDGITADYNGILVLLQVVVLKETRVQAAPLSLQVDKRATSWFRQREDSNLESRQFRINIKILQIKST